METGFTAFECSFQKERIRGLFRPVTPSSVRVSAAVNLQFTLAPGSQKPSHLLSISIYPLTSRRVP